MLGLALTWALVASAEDRAAEEPRDVKRDTALTADFPRGVPPLTRCCCFEVRGDSRARRLVLVVT